MGKKPVTILKVNGYSIYPYHLRKTFADKDGYRGINIRAVNKDDPKPKEFNFELYDQKLVRIKALKFEKGKIIEGHSKQVREELNLRIHFLHTEIANYFKYNLHVIKDELMTHLYSKTLKKKKQIRYVNIPVHDRKDGGIIGEERLTTEEINELMGDLPKDLSKVTDADTGEMVFQSREDVEEHILAAKATKELNIARENFKRELETKTPEERYKMPNGWDKTNIFHLFGYLRYVIKKDAAGNDKPLIHYDFRQHMKKLLFYRANAKPKEHVKDFNEHWVHEFYKFLKEKGFDESVHRLSHSPFKTDPNYLITEKSRLKQYNLNTFGDAISKHMIAYIKALDNEELIKDTFSHKIDAQAFAKTKDNEKGLMTNYNDNVDFLEPSEFLKVMYADVTQFKKQIESEVLQKKVINGKKIENVNQTERQKLIEGEVNKVIYDLEATRDSFTLSVLLGGLRVSDLITTEKKITNLTAFSMIQFEQRKTGGLVNNHIIKPAQKILKKYDDEIPVTDETSFNKNLKKLLKLLNMNREIKWTELTMKGANKKMLKLHDAISTKFARSTYYVICGAMGETLDSVIKRTGHSDKAIALKHYYQVGTHYTEKDLIKLFDVFGRKKNRRK